MARLQRRRFEESDDIRKFKNGRVEVLQLGDRVVGRSILLPGWRWSTDVKPIAGTEWCEYHHLSVLISGRFRVQLPDGIEMEIRSGDLYEIPPGHDAWVVGDEPAISLDMESLFGFGQPRPTGNRRTLASIVLSDIVESTARAVTVGPVLWHELVSRHNELAERVIEGNDGRLVKTTGDGAIGLFDSAERAVRAAAELPAALKPLELEVRTAVHGGEVELSESDVRGVAVHVAARMASVAEPGDVIVSATIRDLVEGSALTFEDYGLHDLKGLPGQRQLYRLVSGS